MAKGLFIVVSAPSGAGKSSICQRFMQACPEIKFSVSYTSRSPRPNEVNGKDYYFISREEFQARIDQGEFVEWIENYGHLYGSSRKNMEEFLHDGQDLLLQLIAFGHIAQDAFGAHQPALLINRHPMVFH